MISQSQQKKNILFIILCLLLFLVSCSHNDVIYESSNNELQNIKNRIFFVIHGDGSYLYHDQNGYALNADEQALKYAIETAKSTPNSEVYIYYVKKKEHFLFFFPKKDRDFYYFRNKKLVNKVSFSSNENFFNAGTELNKVNRDISNFQHHVNNYFFYYGHEIPLFDGTGYFNSFPERKFNIDSLSLEIKKLTEIFKDKFQLIVLSTCNSGNPYLIYKIIPYSNYSLASPGDLHLSYIDSRGIIKVTQSNKPSEENYNEFAKNVYDGLCARTKTLVVLSLYKNNIVMPELEKYFKENSYNITGEGINNSQFFDCSDCSQKLLSANLEKGTTVFYRPPFFGKMKNKKNHSGWCCFQDSSNKLTTK